MVEAAVQPGPDVSWLSRYRVTGPDRGGLILGYSNLDERRIGPGVALLAEAVRRPR